MIRVKVTPNDLRKAITRVKAYWFERARKETAKVKVATNPEFPSLWSEIKEVYIALQNSKCGFCEKPLEGKIEQDVEHYRPKAKVKGWKVPKAIGRVLADEGFQVVQPADGSDEPGYRSLAYHPGNYLMACKTCNSVLKKNYFPIAGKRNAGGSDPAKMKGEKPYLFYPIGDVDEDPEELIQHYGLSPQPVKKAGFGRVRALVTIEIFRLDGWRNRKILLKARAHLIRELYLALRAIDTEKDKAMIRKRKVLVQELLAGDNPFTNCMRCFHRLYRTDPGEAGQVFDGIPALLKKSSP